MSNAKKALEEARKEFGIKSRTTTKTNNNGKQSTSASPKNNTTKNNTTKKNNTQTNNKAKMALEEARKEFGITRTSSKPSNTPKKPTDYSSTVKYLQDRGVKGASGIMTEREWQRRNKSGGTYQDYLNDIVSKYEKGNVHKIPKSPQPNNKEPDASGWDIAKNTFMSGVATFDKGLMSTLDFILPTELLGEKYDFISRLNDYYSKQDEIYKQKKSESLQGKGVATKILADVGEGTVAALPNAILALMSGGMSAAGTTLGQSASASTGLLSTLGNTARATMKNPMYWTSMAQTLGTDYEEAKADGANEFVASATAIIKSGINAGIEIGGGIEKLPDSLKSGDTKLIKNWVMSMLEEGNEEVVQGVVSASVDKLTYDRDKKNVSFSDETAIINPQRMAKEFGMGAAVGGVLGGAQTGIVSGANAILNRRYKNMVDTNVPAEEQTTASDPLEQAARDVVQSREASLEMLKDRQNGKLDAEMLETLSQHNVPITTAEVKKVTGLGDRGSELIAKLANTEGKTFTQAVDEVKSTYLTGFNHPEIDIKRVAHTFTADSHKDAYTAGQIDGEMQALAQKEHAKNVVVHKESGFNAENLPSDVTQSQVATLDLMAKALGAKSYIAKGLKGNAELNRSTGEIPIDFNFEREIGTEGNKQKVSIVFHAAHEMAVHRVVELAPEEGSAFVYAMYNHIAGNEPSQYTLADQNRDAYAEQNVEISLAEAMEEVSASNILRLYNNDEAKFHQAIDSIVNGTNEQAKRGFQKYVDYLNKIIRKIREFLSGKSVQERAEIQAELDEITKLRDMFETAFAKAVENRKATQNKSADTNSAKNLENKINEDYNGDINYSLKTKYNEYNTIGMQWAYNSSTQIGDRKVFYNPRTNKFVLVEATKDDVGFIELKTGTYEQLREDEKIYESNKQREFSDNERDIDTAIHNFESGQNHNTRSNVNVGNRRTGIQNAEVSERKPTSNGTTDTQTSNESLDEGKSFSLKGTNNINTKDRKELLDIIEHLKGEFEITKFAKADPKKLAKMTRDILKEYDSRADYDETFKAIDELYQHMANGEEGHPPVWEDVYNRAYHVAQEIAKNALVVDDYAYQEYKYLRDYLRTTPMNFNIEHDSVPLSYENFNDFRKHNMGRLNFTKDGMSIDSVYQELAGMYPEFFDAEEQINSADQLERIIDVLDELRPTEVNPFKREIEQVSMYLANDLTSRFFDIPQAKPTFADKAERRVTEAHIKGAKKVEAVRQQKDAKIKKLIEAQKEKTKKQLNKIREQRDTKVKKEQEKRREAISKMSEHQKVKVLRARITRHTSDLSKKLLNPTDNQHIPYELQGAAAKLLECINLESNYTYDTESNSYKKNDKGLPTKRTQAFHELQKVYADISSSVVIDPDLLGEHGLLSGVMALADKRIADMNSDELDTVWQAIRAIEASVSTANRVFSEGKFATILEFAEALKSDNEGKKEKTEFKGVLGGVKTLSALNMLTPETYLHYLGDAGDSIFRMMRDAQDKHISIMKEVSEFTNKELKDVDVNSLEKTIHTVKLGGEDIQLSTAQIMELYVLMKREQAREHILVGGILPDVTESKSSQLITKAKPIRNITVSDISTATSKLTDEQKKIADKLQRYVSSVLSVYGNEASMKVYNYEKFLEQNYWTIRTNKQEITSDVDKDTAVTSVANKGMTKATKPHANTSVRIGSIFDTFASHSSEMATYAAWLGTTEDINRIRNFVFSEIKGTGKEKIKIRTGTVKEILDTVHGTQGSKYLEKLLTDIAIGVKGIDNMNPFDKAIGNYKAASVGGNLRVIIQQPTAILRALDMIDAQYLVKGVVSPLKAWEKAKKYAPIAQWKDWGHFDINTGRQMKDVLFDDATKLEKIKQVGMWGASKADSISWGLLWNAVEAETKAKHKGLDEGTAAYYETVAKRFTEIVDHTQVVDGILQRSQVMRNPDSLSKIATSFMGEPTKQYNMAVMAAYDAKNQKGDARKKAVARLGRTSMSLVLSGIVNACAQSFVDAMRDDDKEKKYWEKWLAAFKGDEDDAWFQKLGNIGDTFNPLNYVPFVKDVVSILSGYDVKRMDMETITKTLNAVNNMYKAVTDTGKYTIKEASAQLFVEIARMYGLPVANVKKDIKSLVMTMAIESDNYLMQYRIEKAMLDINYAGNSKNYMDILCNAYNNDREAYEFIYNDMLASGYDAEKIQSGMETRMKKAEGVEKTSELAKRYMTPNVEKKYDNSLKKVKTSQVWKSANAMQRKEAEADLYDFLTSTSETTEKVRAEARAFGVDETEYILWQLAIEMADQSTGQMGSGTYDYKEKAEAINSLNLGDKEIAYFFGKGLNESSKQELNETLNAGIDIYEYVNFKAAVSEMKSDKNAKGNSIPNSKKRKVVNYLNNAGLTDEEWDYFYYEIMNYKK